MTSRKRRRLLPFVLAAIILALPASLILSTAPSALGPNECRPAGMSDEEAHRIYEIAESMGRRFRNRIGEMRGSGISMATDTTHAELMTDKAAKTELAREGAERWVVPAGGIALATVSKARANYFAFELDARLLRLAGEIAPVRPESRFAFEIETAAFDFALIHFTQAASLNYLGRERSVRSDGTVMTRHRFQESFWPFRADTLWFIEVPVKYRPSERVLTVAYPLFRQRDLKSRLALPPSHKTGPCPRTHP